MNWFRFYHEALDDPKVQLLPPATFKNWVNVLCMASKSTPRGVVPPVKDVCFSLHVNAKRAVAILEELEGYGLLDRSNGWYAPHNWKERQKPSDSSAERVKRYRERQDNNDNDSGNVTETLHTPLQKRSGNGPAKEEEKEIDTEPPTPQGNEPTALTVIDGGKPIPALERRFNTFWQAYPKRVGKQAAFKVWQRIRPNEAMTSLMLDAIDLQVRSRDWKKDSGQFIPHPATWLGQGRWDDEPGLEEETRVAYNSPRSTKPVF